VAVNTAGMVARQRFGQELKLVREQARAPEGGRVKQIDAARALGRKTVDRVSRLERGIDWPEVKELEVLLKLYHADLETSTRLRTMYTEGQAIAKAWWTEFEEDFPESLIQFVAYEDSAPKITTCAANVIPGVLQTPSYGRALSSSLGKSIATPNDVERSVELRINRRRIFDKQNPPAVEAIIGEAALRQQVGGPAVMLAQLDSLVEDATQRGVDFRVIPFSATATLTYTFHVFEFSGEAERPLAAFDAMTGISFRKDPKDVRGLRGFVESLRDLSRTPLDSLEEIRTIRKEMSSD
jgi:hypothetical protein